jgi:KDO2-lipid IV(A) lauroyltransferase
LAPADIVNIVIKIKNLIEYCLLRAFTALLLSFPLDYSLPLARWLADVFYFFPSKFRRRGLQHLKMAYPDKSAAELRRILKDVFEHFTMMLVEVLSFPRKIRRYNYTKYVEIKGLELIDQALKGGKGVMFISAHFGNWEMIGYAVSLLGYQINTVARFMPNQAADALLNYSRRFQGQRIIYNDNAVRDMMRALKNNRILALVCDQDARVNGVFVDFMGLPSSTVRSPALLHLKLGTPLLMLYCYRPKPNKFYYTFSFERCPLPALNPATAEKQITQAFTADIEKMIRKYPEQWMWMHRRWKTRPQMNDGNHR